MKQPKPKINQLVPTLMLIILFCLNISAQNQWPQPEILGGIVPERGQVFEQGYGGANEEAFLGLAKTSFGIAACGWQEDGNGDKVGWIVEIDSIGEPINQWAYSGSGDRVLNSIVSDVNGGYLAAGRIVSQFESIDLIHDADTAWLIFVDGSGYIARV
ncbi:MAG: hypothetical protein ACPGD5_10670 [Salibacteraceae bacterium]